MDTSKVLGVHSFASYLLNPMSRTASIIGTDGKTWKSIKCGSASACRDEFKYGKFAGFTRVVFMDTSGTVKKKKGAGKTPKKAPAK